MITTYTCPNCRAAGMTVFYELRNVPVHSVMLVDTRDEAINFTTGDIALGRCHTCGFVSNVKYDPDLQHYDSDRYEATQSYSPTFNKFAQRLAEDLINRFHLRHKDIIEIGCGQGEFLISLCEMGENHGIGFDPAYVAARALPTTAQNIQFVADFYSEKYVDHHGDFVCCKMTLEHIGQTADFIGTVRRSVGDRPETTVFFQIPNATYVFRDLAFWDVYYEHCSYFNKSSLSYLFRHAGFDVLSMYTDYDDQYLMIEAKPSANAVGSMPMDAAALLTDAIGDVDHFIAHNPAKVEGWRKTVDEIKGGGKRAVIWGGGSKGVAFLTTLGIREEIPYAVDINPNKHGKFMAGTGQEIVAPEKLIEYQPDIVIVMNPIYCDEIQRDLDRMGVKATLMPV